MHPAEANTGRLHGSVELTERLGSETVIDLKLADGSKIIAALSEDTIMPSGTDVSFDFDPQQAHIFPETL